MRCVLRYPATLFLQIGLYTSTTSLEVGEVDGTSGTSMRKKAAGVRTTGKAGCMENGGSELLSELTQMRDERGAHEVILVEAFAERDLPPHLRDVLHRGRVERPLRRARPGLVVIREVDDVSLGVRYVERLEMRDEIVKGGEFGQVDDRVLVRPVFQDGGRKVSLGVLKEVVLEEIEVVGLRVGKGGAEA